MTLIELQEAAVRAAEAARKIKDEADAETRDMTAEEALEFDKQLDESAKLEKVAERQAKLEDSEARLNKAQERRTTPETAEGIKYVANTMLLTYISFWNGVGAKLGEKIPGLDIDALRVGVTSDDRISTWGSLVSNGAGGSCFGKDIRSLIYQLQRLGVDTKMLESSYEANEYQKVYLIDRAINEAGFSFNNKVVAVIGLAFKHNTNDMRDASSIDVIEGLLAKGVAKVMAYDPLANEAAKEVFDPKANVLFEKIEFCDSPNKAIEGTDALFISSDCDEFRGVSSTIRSTVKPPYLVLDGRRMIPDYRELVENGYTYLAVGSTALMPDMPDMPDMKDKPDK